MDAVQLARFFADLSAPIDHVMVTAGRPHYANLLQMDLAEARRALDEHLLLPLQVARLSAGKLTPGGTLLFMSGTGGRRPGLGFGLIPTVTSALPALIASLALELTPVRINLIAAASSTHRSRRRSWAMSWRTAAASCAPHFPSGVWSAPKMLRPWPCTS